MSALANCFKTRFTLWQDGEDIPFAYTSPSKKLAPKLTLPKRSTAVELHDWLEFNGLLDAVAE